MAFARLQRRGGAGEQQQKQQPKSSKSKADERVGEILSDSNSELSSVDDDDDVKSARAATKKQAAAPSSRQKASRESSHVSLSSGSSEGSERAERNNNSKIRSTRETSSGAKIQQLPAKSSPPPVAKNQTQSQSQSQSRNSRGMKKTGSRKWYSDSENDDDDDDDEGKRVDDKGSVTKANGAKSAQKQKQRSLRNHKSQEEKRKTTNNEDEDNEEEVEAVHSIEDDDSDLEKFISGSMVTREDVPSPSPAGADADESKAKSKRKLKKLGSQLGSPAREAVTTPSSSAAAQVVSPTSASESETSRGGGLDPQVKKKTGFQKLVAKTFSPFSSRRKSIESPTMNGNGDPTTSGRNKSNSNAVLSPSSDVLASPATGDRKESTASNRKANQCGDQQQHQIAASSGKRPSMNSDTISPLTNSKGSRTNSANHMNPGLLASEPSGQLINRRTSRLKQSPNGSELAGLPRSLGSPQEAAARRAYETAAAAVAASGGSSAGAGSMGGSEALSPGQRKLAGPFLGTPGSGVVLEGWLRQKQRRGMKGMKKWNSRYFVLYAKTNEVRYYADVVQSAWGPMPLGEIGSISLRLIQRIGKPSHPKYRGCRFDITCRNSWGTHYADDYVSSDEENSNNPNSTNSVDEAKQQDRTSTPRSSRVYSLMADSPQTTVTWVNTLDSLLVRSANSPRPDMAPNSAPGSGGSKGKRMPSSKAIARGRRSSALESETLVLLSAGDNVPRPVKYAIHYIFESTPGIETVLFYQEEPDQAKLKTSLKFLNQFSTDPSRKPSMEELEVVLDPVTAGGIVKLWLKQLETPVVPFEMFENFQALARSAKAAPFGLKRDLRALIDVLPPRNFAMLACMLSHLNEVNLYASENGMDAALLSKLFAEFILRPRRASPRPGGNSNAKADEPTTTESAAENESEKELSRELVEEMISNVDAIIDEKVIKDLAVSLRD